MKFIKKNTTSMSRRDNNMFGDSSEECEEREVTKVFKCEKKSDHTSSSWASDSSQDNSGEVVLVRHYHGWKYVEKAKI